MRSFFFSLLAISIFTFALSQVPTEVVLGEPLIVEEKANVVTHFISYTMQETDLDYIRIKTTPKSQINPGKIFIHIVIIARIVIYVFRLQLAQPKPKGVDFHFVSASHLRDHSAGLTHVVPTLVLRVCVVPTYFACFL